MRCWEYVLIPKQAGISEHSVIFPIDSIKVSHLVTLSMTVV
jgi:hypothetical protein